MFCKCLIVVSRRVKSLVTEKDFGLVIVTVFFPFEVAGAFDWFSWKVTWLEGVGVAEVRETSPLLTEASELPA